MKILQYYDQNHNKKRGIINYKDLKIVSTLQTGEKELTFSLPHNYAKDLVNEGYIRTKEDEYVREMEYSQDVNGLMPYLIIHHNLGGQWDTYRDYSNENTFGIPWHLSDDERGDPSDFSINAKYYPT